MGITYYDTGTATLSVGSKTMTGQGTLWAGWVKPGDQVMPEEGTNNVVDVVVSNTEITLLKQYRGVAQAARPYTIMRTPDAVFTESLARMTFQKINDSTLVALAGITAAPNRLPYLDGTSAAATVDFKAWARSLLGLTPAADKIAYFSDANTTALADFKAWVRNLFGLTPSARKGIRFDASGNPALFDFSDKGAAFLALSDEPAMRNFLSLVLQVSATDTTPGSVLKVGSFGVGIPVALASGSNLNTVTTGGSYYATAATNAPGSGYGWMYVNPYDASNASQVFTDVTNGTRYERIQISGTWSRWRTSASSIALSAPNLNTPRPGGTYYVSAGVNAPGSTYGWWRVRDCPVSDDYSDEDFTDVTDRARYKRTKLGGVYSPWTAS